MDWASGEWHRRRYRSRTPRVRPSPIPMSRHRTSATSVTVTTKTNASGEYRFNNLPVGAYKISASAQGFQSSTRQTPVDLNSTITVNLKLNPGSASTTIEVSAAPPTLDTTTAQVTNTYGEIAAADVATVSTGGAGLGVLNLSLYSAGVASPGRAWAPGLDRRSEVNVRVTTTSLSREWTTTARLLPGRWPSFPTMRLPVSVFCRISSAPNLDTLGRTIQHCRAEWNQQLSRKGL